MKLPTHIATQQVIERKRKAAPISLARPHTLAKIETTVHLQISLRGDQFLLADTGKDDVCRMLIFLTKENLQQLSNAEVWLSDGTFKIAPPLFTQLYTVHGLVNNTVVPLVYALLPNRTVNSYERPFWIIHDSIVDHGFSNRTAVDPKTMIFDFELTATGAAKKVIQHTGMRGKCCQA